MIPSWLISYRRKEKYGHAASAAFSMEIQPVMTMKIDLFKQIVFLLRSTYADICSVISWTSKYILIFFFVNYFGILIYSIICLILFIEFFSLLLYHKYSYIQMRWSNIIFHVHIHGFFLVKIYSHTKIFTICIQTRRGRPRW